MPQIKGPPPQVCNCPELVEKLKQQKKMSATRQGPSAVGTQPPRKPSFGTSETNYAAKLAQVLPKITPKPQVGFNSNYWGTFTIQCEGKTFTFSGSGMIEDPSKAERKSLSLKITKPDGSRTEMKFEKTGKSGSITIDEYPDRTSKRPSSMYTTSPEDIQRFEKTLVDPAYRYLSANRPKP